MKTIISKPLFFGIMLILISMRLNAQTNPLVQKIDNYYKTLPKEKIYLSFDKSNYNAGDTLWFKSFLLNANHTSSSRTDKIYVELFNDSSKFIGNRVIALNNGLGYGDFALKNNLPDGTYTIRAYSNWQQNFGDDYFFQKSFSIGNVGEHTWLLNAYQKIKMVGTKENLDLKVRITNVKNEPAGLRDVDIYFMEDGNVLMKTALQTTVDGLIETQLPLPAYTANSNYSFHIVDKKDKSKRAKLPVALNKVDLQFMPEGGFMVNGIYGKIAFKAIGPNGLGVNLNGKITNSKNETIADLTTIHKGMGSFYMLPQKGETYTANYTLNGIEQKQNLPIAKNEGTTLRIDHLSKPDSLYVYIKATEEKREERSYQLIAQNTDGINVAILVNLKNGFATFKLPKKSFSDGVIHFTLFSPDQLPVNERQAFINYSQKLNLQIKAGNMEYSPRDSVSLMLSATAENGLPLSGTFSVSVTDDQQVNQETDEENILSHFLFQSEIKGNVEDAGWYLNNPDSSKFLALDYLLLTQAWVGYKWDEVLKPLQVAAYKAEKDNLIEGKITGLFNKPMPNIQLTLLALGKNIFVADTVSNEDGKFLFKDLPILDSVAYSIKIKNAKGKTSGATISVDEFTPAKDNIFIKPRTPWYVNSDSTSLLNYAKLADQRKKIEQGKRKIDGEMLNEVEIVSKAKLSDFVSKTAWDANYFKKIGKEELDKNPRRKLIDLLKDYIDGFTIGRVYADGCSGSGPRKTEDGKKIPGLGTPYQHDFDNFLIGSKLISHVMIDKINTHLVSTGIDDNYNETGISRTAIEADVFPVNNAIFNMINADDIVNIDVYKGCNYFFLDITTRSGKGPWVAPSKGIYVHKPLPIYIPREFYSPKYAVNKNSALPDLRSTIFWDANVVTDENGKAKLSFYASDLPGSYTIKIEGTDMYGRFGYQKSTISIKNKTESK